MNSKVFLFICTAFFTVGHAATAQTENSTFKAYQLNMPRVNQAYSQYNNYLQSAFAAKGLQYPPSDIYIRAFKAQNEMEIWVKDRGADTYTLFKKYDICALSGSLGPKRWEGDKQVPEGLYFISDFNPQSAFHLSMLINYPNYSDLILGNKATPGGDIYIHGSCMTVGCMPMTDEGIKEIYVLCLQAKINGQNNIPVHVFPVRFNKGSISFLGREYADDENRQRFWINLKAGFDHFEKTRTILPVMYNREGKYVF